MSPALTRRNTANQHFSASQENATVESLPAPSIDDADLDGMSEEAKKIVNILFSKLTEFFSSDNEKKNKRIAKLEEDVVSLKSSLDLLQEKFDLQEERVETALQEQIKGTLILSGEIPICTPNENCSDVVVKSFHDSLHLNINPADIISASRVGTPKRENEIDKRPIKFSFNYSSNADHRKDITMALARVKPKIYLNEYLTPYKQDLLRKVRENRRLFPESIKQCYVNDGVIVIKKLSDSGRNTKIKTQKDLNNFLSKIVPNPSVNRNNSPTADDDPID